MTTGFDYTRPAPVEGQPAGSLVRDPAFLGDAPLGEASATAQKRGGLGIHQVNRGYLELSTAASSVAPATSANYTFTNTTPAELDPVRFAGQVWCSGKRPVRIDVSLQAALETTGGNLVVFQPALDGVGVGGISWVLPPALAVHWPVHFHRVIRPTRGQHKFSLLAWVTGGQGNVAAATSSGHYALMTVTEL